MRDGTRRAQHVTPSSRSRPPRPEARSRCGARVPGRAGSRSPPRRRRRWGSARSHMGRGSRTAAATRCWSTGSAARACSSSRRAARRVPVSMELAGAFASDDHGSARRGRRGRRRLVHRAGGRRRSADGGLGAGPAGGRHVRAGAPAGERRALRRGRRRHRAGRDGGGRAHDRDRWSRRIAGLHAGSYEHRPRRRRRATDDARDVHGDRCSASTWSPGRPGPDG